LLVKSNSDSRPRHRLRGALAARSSAVRRAQNLLAQLELTAPRAWQPKLDKIVARLRAIAADQRSSADLRIDAILRLGVIDGALGENELGDSATDKLIRALLRPVAPDVPKVEIPAQPTETIAERLARFTREFESDSSSKIKTEVAPAPVVSNPAPETPVPNKENPALHFAATRPELNWVNY
jgi:hypothetical protein